MGMIKSDRFKPQIKVNHSEPPNGGWGWMVVFGAFLCTFMLGGLSFTVGILYAHIMTMMDIGLAEVAWIGSLLVGFTWTSAIFTGPLTHIIGYRLIVIIGGFILSTGILASAYVTSLPVLYFTLGVLPGIGLNMSFMGSIIAINKYFNKRQSLALGFAMCGIGVGTTVFSPTVQWLLEEYDFGGTLLVLSAICLHVVPCGFLYFPLNTQGSSGEEWSKQRILHLIRESFDVSVLRDVYFVMFVLSNFLTHLGLYVPTAFLPDHVVYLGFTPDDVPLLLSIFGVSGVIGRVLCGPVCERFWKKRLSMCISSIYLCAGSTVLLAFSKNYSTLLLSSSLLGPFQGTYIIIGTVLIVDLFGVQKLPTTMSLVTLAQGLGSVVGAPMAGIIADATGYNQATFLYASITIALGATVLIPILKHKSSPRDLVLDFRLDVATTVNGETDIRVFVIDFDILGIDGAAAA